MPFLKSRGHARAFSLMLVLGLVGVNLAGCAGKPYRIDIQQGNVVSPEQFAQLKPGMTRDQVRFLLGTPLLTDVFHEQRWDYHYRLISGASGEVTSRGIALFFDKNGLLERIVADEAFRALPPAEGSGNRVFDLSGPKG